MSLSSRFSSVILALLAEGHRPVAVERAARIDAHGQRVDLAVLAPAAGEEVAHRHFDRRLGLAVPVEAEDVEPRLVERGGRHPDLLDRAGAVDLGQRERGLGRDPHRGRDLPALAQVAGGVLAGALGGHAGLALLAGEVLRADRARLGVGQPGQVAQVHVQAVERPALCEQVRGRQANQSTDGQQREYARSVSMVQLM